MELLYFSEIPKMVKSKNSCNAALLDHTYYFCIFKPALYRYLISYFKSINQLFFIKKIKDILSPSKTEEHFSLQAYQNESNITLVRLNPQYVCARRLQSCHPHRNPIHRVPYFIGGCLYNVINVNKVADGNISLTKNNFNNQY